MALKWGVAAELVGQTLSSSQFEIKVDGKIFVRTSVPELKAAWESATRICVTGSDRSEKVTGTETNVVSQLPWLSVMRTVGGVTS